MPCSALRGLYMDKYLSICEWRKRDDSQPVSYVWRPGIKQTGTCSVTPGNPDNDINTYTYTFFLHPSAPPHPPHCISHSLTHTHTHAALSANFCQRHHPLGSAVSFVHTVIRQLASSAFSCLYLDDPLHPNELCQNGIWHKPSIKHSWQILRVWKSRISLVTASCTADNSWTL